jgi:hypothetical protein
MKKEQQVNKKVLSFFLIGFPTILIIALGMLVPEAWWAMIVIAIYQFIMLKQFLDQYYEVM